MRVLGTIVILLLLACAVVIFLLQKATLRDLWTTPLLEPTPQIQPTNTGGRRSSPRSPVVEVRPATESVPDTQATLPIDVVDTHAAPGPIERRAVSALLRRDRDAEGSVPLAVVAADGTRVDAVTDASGRTVLSVPIERDLTLLGADDIPLWIHPSAIATDVDFIQIEIPRPIERFGGLLQPDVFISLRDRSEQYEVFVRGRTTLPEGEMIHAQLAWKGRTVATSLTRVIDGDPTLAHFRSGSPLHAGEYRLSLSWRPHTAEASAIDTLRSSLPSGDWPNEFVVARPIVLGADVESDRQRYRCLRFFRDALNDAQVARDIVLGSAWFARGRANEMPPNAAPWKQEYRFFNSEARKRQVVDHELGETLKKLSKAPFSIPVWRRLVDEALPRRFEPFLDPSRIPYPERYPSSTANLGPLMREILRFARLESQLIYTAGGRAASNADRVDIEFGLTAERDISFERVETLMKAVLEGVGGVESLRSVK